MHGVRPNILILGFELSSILTSSVDVEIHHLETPHQLEFTNISVVAQGPLRAALKAVVKYGKSMIEVIVSISSVVSQDVHLMKFVGRSPWMLLLVCPHCSFDFSHPNDRCLY